MESISAANKIRCVTYKDEFSSMHSSYNDLMIGAQNGVVGCSSKVFGSSKIGDIVLITANNDKEKYFVVGVLTNVLDNCNLWHEGGGFTWEYNFEYTPLSKIIHIDEAFTQKMMDICTRHGVNDKYMLHSRFCGIRYKNVLLDMFKEHIITM